MANRRKTKKKATRRRRRVGAMALTASNPLVKYGSMAAGFFVADDINQGIDKFTGTMDAKAKGAITSGIGAGLVFMKLGKKKTVVETVAGGLLIGAGAKRLLKEFGIMNGFRAVPAVNGAMPKRLNGYQNVNVLNGYPTARIPMNGYKVPGGVSTSLAGNGYSRSYGSSGFRD